MHIYHIDNENGTKTHAKLFCNDTGLEWRVSVTEKANHVTLHFAGRYHVDAFLTAYEAAHTVNARVGCLTGA